MTALGFTDPKTATWADMDVPAREAAVRALAALGVTSSVMALELQTTKSAVVGLAFRKRIPLPQQANQMPFVRSATFKAHPLPAPEVWAPIGPPTASPTRRQCCWPVGEATGAQQMFCGGKRSRGSYCETHAAMAFAPRRGDPAYSARLMGPGRAVEPGITAEEAVSIVVGRVKVEASDE